MGGDRTAQLARRRVDAWIGGGFFVAGALLRLAHVASIRHTPFTQHLILDPEYYDAWARRIAQGEWLGQEVFFVDPLYAYFLAAVYAVAGTGRLPVLVLQAVAGALVAPLVWYASRPWLGRVAAASAAGLAAVYLPSIYYEGSILKTWLDLLLGAGVLALLSAATWRAARGDSGRGPLASWALAGLALGLAALARGNLVLLVPVLGAWVLLDGGRRDSTERGRVVGRRAPAPAWRAAGAFVAGALLLVGATTLRNRVVGGEWILLTANAGQNFYIGNNPANDSGEYAVLPFVKPGPRHEQDHFAREAARRAGRSLSAGDVSRFWFGEGLRWIRSDPGAWLALSGKKLRKFWGAYEIPDNFDLYLVRESAPLLRLPLPGFGTLGPLALLGAFFTWRRRGFLRAVLLWAATCMVSVLPFFVLSRFRVAAIPALLVLAGAGAAGLAARARAAWRERGAALGFVSAAVVLLLAFAFVNFPVRGPRASPGLRLAAALGLPVEPESSAIAHYNLGLVYAARVKDSDEPRRWLDLAEAELRLALAEDARWAKVWVELGKVLAREDRDAEAIEMFEMAARLEPDVPTTHHALGLLFRRGGRTVAAEAAFRRALALAPDQVSSALELGEVLLAQGRRPEAAEAFRLVLRRAPDNARARAGLAAAGSQ